MREEVSELSPPPERMRDCSLPSVLSFTLSWEILLPRRPARIRKGKMKVNPPGGHRTGDVTVNVEILKFI